MCSACDVWNTVSVSTSELMPAFPQKMGPFFFFSGHFLPPSQLVELFFPLDWSFPQKGTSDLRGRAKQHNSLCFSRMFSWFAFVLGPHSAVLEA